MLPICKQVEELVLIRCSLLPGEKLQFLDPASHLGASSTENIATKWESAISVDGVADDMDYEGLLDARFQVLVHGATIFFEIDYQGYNGSWESINDCISINGDNLSRAAQERWRARIKEKVKEVVEAGGE